MLLIEVVGCVVICFMRCSRCCEDMLGGGDGCVVVGIVVVVTVMIGMVVGTVATGMIAAVGAVVLLLVLGCLDISWPVVSR